eukprot:gene22248-30490_t
MNFGLIAAPVLVLLSVVIIFSLAAKPQDQQRKKTQNFVERDCPICFRVLRAVKDISRRQQLSVEEAFVKFCLVPSIEVEEQKFCYNMDPLRQELNRLFKFGADDIRICKKIAAINSDFCLAKDTSKSTENPHPDRRKNRGIIYI